MGQFDKGKDGVLLIVRFVNVHKTCTVNHVVMSHMTLSPITVLCVTHFHAESPPVSPLASLDYILALTSLCFNLFPADCMESTQFCDEFSFLFFFCFVLEMATSQPERSHTCSGARSI